MDSTTMPGPAATWSPELPDAAGFVHTVIETPGLRTHVATIGEGEPVILLHGFPQHWWQWRVIAPLLASAGFRAVCPDLRGSGWTSAESPRFHVESHRDDVIALMDALDIDRAHIIAHDMGAISAMQCAYSAPDRVKSLVQLAVPPGFMQFTPKLIPAFAHMPALIMHRPGASLRELFGARYARQPVPEDVRDAYLCVQQRAEVDRAVAGVFRGMVVPTSLRLARGFYKRQYLTPPTLVAFGRHDGPFQEDTVRHICRHHQRHAAQFELAFVDDAAHFLTDDAPDAVAELLQGWLSRNGAA